MAPQLLGGNRRAAFGFGTRNRPHSLVCDRYAADVAYGDSPTAAESRYAASARLHAATLITHDVLQRHSSLAV